MEEEYIYKSSDGTETPVSKMQNSHLLNALLKKYYQYAPTPKDSTDPEEMELKRAVDAMKAEVLKRMPIPTNE